MTAIEQIENDVKSAIAKSFANVSGLLIWDGAYPDVDDEYNKIFKASQSNLNGSIYISWIGEKASDRTEKIGKVFYTDFGICILCISKTRKGTNSVSEYYEKVMKAMSEINTNFPPYFISGEVSPVAVKEDYFYAQLVYSIKIRRAF